MKAAQMLKLGELPVGQVAERVGYKSEQAFNRSDVERLADQHAPGFEAPPSRLRGRLPRVLLTERGPGRKSRRIVGRGPECPAHEKARQSEDKSSI